MVASHDDFSTVPKMSLIPVILCGGAGSRLWPLSRELHPKPFIRINNGKSFLQNSFLRGANLPGVEEVLTVTNRDLVFLAQDDYREVNEHKLPLSFILEPFGRNTAAAVAAAALDIERRCGGDAILLILAADHLIADEAAFGAAVAAAVDFANRGQLVTFGIRPTGPETGYGYLETLGNEVLRFVEKPDLVTAQGYVESGRFLWNSGMFCFRADVVLREMREHCPEVLDAVQICLSNSAVVSGHDQTQLQLNPESFSSVPDISFDYALMEKSSHVSVVPCDMGWSDIGSWDAMAELTPADALGNRVEGDVWMLNTRDCYVHSPDRMVGMLGTENLIVVDTPDALLIIRRDQAQEVKQLFTELKKRGQELHRIHRTVHRPWGTYTVLEEGNGFKIKRIEVKPGASLSLQMHHHRSEHWVVVSGVASVVNGERDITVETNQSTFIPAGHKHRLYNPGLDPCVMIEVQSGGYLGEDDIVRFEDNYGRVV